MLGSAYRWFTLILALCCSACSGSGGAGLHPATGKVLHNNQPAKGVVLTFHPKGGDPVTTVRPVGVTNEAGEYKLTTGDKDGAAPGEYTVTMIWPEDVEAKGKKKLVISTGGPESQDRLNGTYSHVAKSNIKVTLKEGPNQIDVIEIK